MKGTIKHGCAPSPVPPDTSSLDRSKWKRILSDARRILVFLIAGSRTAWIGAGLRGRIQKTHPIAAGEHETAGDGARYKPGHSGFEHDVTASRPAGFLRPDERLAGDS
jgi:hypothetical protein